MTNAQIILNNSIVLMKEGILKGSGIMTKDENGNVFELPETIHTFATWKALGYIVKKGQKCKARFQIWKYAGIKNEETEEETGRLFLKESYFFTREQVEAI